MAGIRPGRASLAQDRKHRLTATVMGPTVVGIEETFR